MKEVKGVGPTVSSVLIAFLPELGSIDMGRNPIAALAGLATYNHDSGPKNGKRYIKGGRAKVREALYMAMQSACRFNPIISAHYNKLI